MTRRFTHRALPFAAVGTILAGIAWAESVTVDFGRQRRPVDHRYAGFLHSLSSTAPGRDRYEVLKPFIMRGSRKPKQGPAFGALPRATAAGASWQYVLSDDIYWFGLPKPGENGNFAAWDAYVDQKIAEAR